MTRKTPHAAPAFPKADAFTHLVNLTDGTSRVALFDAAASGEYRPDLLEPLAWTEIVRRSTVSQNPIPHQVALIADVFARTRFEPNRIDNRICSDTGRISRFVQADMLAPGAMAALAPNRRFDERWLPITIGLVALK